MSSHSLLPTLPASQLLQGIPPESAPFAVSTLLFPANNRLVARIDKRSDAGI